MAFSERLCVRSGGDTLVRYYNMRSHVVIMHERRKFSLKIIIYPAICREQFPISANGFRVIGNITRRFRRRNNLYGTRNNITNEIHYNRPRPARRQCVSRAYYNLFINVRCKTYKIHAILHYFDARFFTYRTHPANSYKLRRLIYI